MSQTYAGSTWTYTVTWRADNVSANTEEDGAKRALAKLEREIEDGTLVFDVSGKAVLPLGGHPNLT